MLLRRLMVVDYDLPAADYAVGVLGGITGGFAGFPGAFVTIWCGLKGWTKNQQRGVYQPFILIMQVMALITLTFMQSSKSISSSMDLMTIVYIPAAALGTWCGIAIFKRLTDSQFAWWVNILLVVSGRPYFLGLRKTANLGRSKFVPITPRLSLPISAMERNK